MNGCVAKYIFLNGLLTSGKQMKCMFIILFLVMMPVIWGQTNQNLRLNHYSASHKLPGMSVQCVYQDGKGVMWLGIESMGLTRYDGKTQVTYYNKTNDTTSISNNYPSRIIEDTQGNIWAATLSGLNRFNRSTQTFTRFFYRKDDPYSISDNSLNDICLDRYGNLWIATTNGVSVYNPKHNEFLRLLYNSNPNNYTDNNEISAIKFDQQGNVWMGSIRFGLFLIDVASYSALFDQWSRVPLRRINQSITNIQNWQIPTSDSDSFSSKAIRSIECQDSDTIWIGTNKGLFVFNVGRKTFVKHEFTHPVMLQLNDASFTELIIDSEKALWAGTSNNGLVVMESNSHQLHYLNADYSGSHNLKSNAIRDMIETPSGIVWIATKFEGLHSFDRRRNNFSLINKATLLNPGLNNEYVLCAYEDTRNQVWIGTKGGGLTQWDRSSNTFIHHQYQPGVSTSIASNRVEMVTEDQQGNLWIATDKGLDCLPPGSKHFKHYLNLNIRNFFYDKNGFLWLGTSNGLFKFNTRSRQMVKHPTRYNDVFNIENNLNITRIIEDRSGILWIGTAKDGLFEYNPVDDQLVIHTHVSDDSTSISGNMIRAIYQDSAGNIWVGTKSDGFNRFNKSDRIFTRFLNPNPQSSNTVYAFLEDPRGNLWMGTHRGVEKFSPFDHQFTLFNTNYGLQGLVFEANAFGYTHDGLMMLGGSNGLNLFHPLKVAYHVFDSPLIVNSIFRNRQKVLNDVSNQSVLELPSNTNTLSFIFALLDYTDPEANTYAYQLENFESDWVYSDSRNFASYTNLAPGDYTFKVKGANSEGLWSDQMVVIQIHINVPFWMSWWFVSLVIVVLLCLIIFINRFRMKMGHRNEERLKEQVRQRTTDLTNAYDKLERVNREIEVRNNELLFQSKKIRNQNLELERHHQNLEKQVNERTRDLELAKLKAEESDRLKSAFLANMSHEIRTPLNAIIGFSDLMTSNTVNPDEMEYMNRIIQSNSNTLLQLINDIIDFSMIEANQLPVNLSPFSIGLFMTDLANDVKSNKTLLEKGLTLNLEIKDQLDDKILNSAPERILQIFNNLINNAIKFTDSGFITLGCQKSTTPDSYLFYVKDTGCGIWKDHQEAIFDRFRKIEDHPSRIYRGTGLGLSISQQLCQLLGGTIWVESLPGNGSTFYFSIPNQTQAAQIKQKPKGHQRIIYPDWSDKTILIAEDEDSNFEVVRYSLLRTHIQIIRAFNGAEAIAQVNQSDRPIPDMVLMDIKMPVMDGIEASRMIKKIVPEMPIIALTGYATPLDKDGFEHVEFDAYIIKPIATRKLLEQMQRLFNR
jgi:signal transduction histidine kinase/ligand-binding sensor domain-containing protein/CheY-like chemotaxis protein